ncbi:MULTISPECIES: hypothetical protein [Pseudonocardia]|uniref:Uncharacterized protein n=2 Tax=Pseudonocardia TaxID=1847 RepID=A0A1Y2N6G8_PSEAH|nr:MULTISPECIES: hypothetical protein [Pseudonocardia]OSY43064.1 hypothetical protein BG845_00668 [Pseudonocardia autotrophica]TDN71551.1 hypothetical protein C8E95_0585 [Pseudonocardia autotrophica]BBG02241.1 hypothetical protein Pdca_34500 [Pseudonocardia autotrophica]GEC23423.1 hypothetical protein PSA01_04520 [Pseudonocardia saturnea]
MGGRHRVHRVRRAPSRRACLDALPVVVAIAAVVAVVAVIVGSGALDRGTASLTQQASGAVPVAAAPRTAPVLELPATDAVATAAGDALRAAARQDRPAPGPVAGCDLDGPPRFDDPADPNRITDRDCGYRDDQGRERSRDPWIDAQLLDAAGN